MRFQELKHGSDEFRPHTRREMIGVKNHFDAYVLHDVLQFIRRWLLWVVLSHDDQRGDSVVLQALFRDFEIGVRANNRYESAL